MLSHPHGVDRRTLLKVGIAGGLGSQMALVESLAWAPERLALAAGPLPDIQFDIGNFIAPPVTLSAGARRHDCRASSATRVSAERSRRRSVACAPHAFPIVVRESR